MTERQTQDTFRVGNRVRVNDSCQWVSLRGEVGTITKDCGGFVFTVDFGGGCYDLKASDFEPQQNEATFSPIPGKCIDIDGNSWHKDGEQCEACGFGMCPGCGEKECGCAYGFA